MRVKRMGLVGPFPAAQTKWAALVCLTVILFWYDDSAAQQGRSSACPQRLSDLAHRLGFAAELNVKDGQLSARAHGGRIRIECAPMAASPTITLSYPSEYPPRAFYELVADASGLAMDSSPDEMRLRAHRCHRAAKRAQGGYSLRRFQDFRLECHRSVSRSVFSLRPRFAAHSGEHSKN